MAVNFITGRGDKDLNEYMYDKISERMKHAPDSHIIILVPEQFTLQAERIAFEKLKVPGLIGVEILSFSRLGHKVLGETGGGIRTHINEQGKHMMLYKIITELHEELEIFGNVAGKHGFISLVNNFITELKQFNICSDELRTIAESLDEDNIILKKKLGDIRLIYDKFSESLENQFIDSEDFINLLIGQIRNVSFLKKASIWIDGFDFFNPQIFLLIEQLMLCSEEVNFNFTVDSKYMSRDFDLFDVSRYTMKKCRGLAEKNNIFYKISTITDKYVKGRAPEIACLEKELYAHPLYAYKADVEHIDIVSCSSYSAELESVASKIVELVRSKGYRFREIAVICNDMDSYGLLISKVFEEYEIPVFMDIKRSIMHNPFVEYLLSMLDVIAKGYKREDIFRFLKTELTELTSDDCEDLENYALRYAIKGSLWKNDFVFGMDELGQEYLEDLNEHRKRIISFFSEFEKAMEEEKSIKDKTEALYGFIRSRTDLNSRIEEWISDLRKHNELSFVREMTQIWNVIISVLDQMVELVGNLEVRLSEYADILRAGLESVEIGIIPTTVDQVLVGTLQRSRIGSVKALFMIGVNDGIIPSDEKSSDLLIFEEKEVLKEENIELSKNEDTRIKEERLAIYKTICCPEAYLWVSYVTADSEGKEMRPSFIISRLKKIFENIEIQKDFLEDKHHYRLISTTGSTKKYLIEQARKAIEDSEMPEIWKSVFNWYQKKDEHTTFMNLLFSGLFYDNKVGKMDKSSIKELYDMPPVFSPTRLECFSRCPFEHFLRYGIKADERRIREVSVIEMGEIYHQSLMRYTQEIINKRLSWQDIDESQCKKIIKDIMSVIEKEYGEGILKRNERYAYRFSRIIRAAQKTAWILTEHVKKGDFNEFYYEVSFGRKGKFPPIQVVLPDGETVYIEGRIDRIDVLRRKEDTLIKVIDYKSGGKKVSLSEVVNGLQLQLMVYLHAALKGFEGDNRTAKPAGVFYFKIDDPIIELTKMKSKEEIKTKIEKQIRKMFKMDGLVLKDIDIIKNMDKDINGFSDVIPVNVKRDGNIGDNSKAMEEKDLKKLLFHMNKLTEEICNNIMQGSIDIRPKKIDNNKTACTYCKYKTICQFDTSLAGQKYEKSDKIKIDDILTN